MKPLIIQPAGAGHIITPDLNELLVIPDELRNVANRAQKFLKDFKAEFQRIIHEAGFLPDEGEVVSNGLLLAANNVNTFVTNTDRAANLELGLFTNVAPADTIAESAITEPTGTGYARIALTDGTWTVANPATYTQQTFTAGAGGWTGSVQGYFIATNLGGTGTKRLVGVEVDAGGPYTFAENDTYDITPSYTAN